MPEVLIYRIFRGSDGDWIAVEEGGGKIGLLESTWWWDLSGAASGQLEREREMREKKNKEKIKNNCNSAI